MQSYFPWHQELSVGLDEIDAQHKLLIDIINRVYDALIGRVPRAEAGRVLEDLVQYTFVHFAVEESLFRITDFPGYEGHKALHDRLKQEVMELKEGFERGEIDLDLNLMAFLRSWLEDHIKGEDKGYAAHLLSAGLKARWERSSWVGRIWSSLR